MLIALVDMFVTTTTTSPPPPPPHVQALTCLDASSTGMKAKAAVVLSNSLYVNTAATHIILDGNALGEEGGRSIIRCMSFQPEKR